MNRAKCMCVYIYIGINTRASVNKRENTVTKGK